MQRNSKNSAVANAARFDRQAHTRDASCALRLGPSWLAFAASPRAGRAAARGHHGAGHLSRQSRAGRVQVALRLRAGHPAAHVLQEDRHADRRRSRRPGCSAASRGCAAPGSAISSSSASSATRRRSSTGPRARAARCCCNRTRLRSPSSAKPSAPSASRARRITGYRQLIDRPFINPQDTREIPNTFEAYTLTRRVGSAVLHRRLHDEDEDARVGRASSGRRRRRAARGRNEGVIYAGATYAFAGTGYVKVDERVLDRRASTRSTSKAGIRSPSTTRPG